ncbi:ras and Rab interactor 3 isoform X2 [Gambusia affinis]|uniref:ras and Rab interactor 3 isoform X2 n=1 Tax=Gambusia affinis TaxID=33528 RepID=UPI001CDC6EDD|nr:ras and Rab interactor 3 isoform X2 [Gambusia affinis]
MCFVLLKSTVTQPTASLCCCFCFQENTKSFLVVRDPVTSQPCLLCVSAGDQNGEVLDYKMNCKGKAFQISESRLSFSDLPQLVLFYSLTRDVLAVCLSIPRWIYSPSDMNQDRLSKLEPKMWLSTPPEQQAEEMPSKEPSHVMCSIQLTSANGALCIINPLYVHEHGDDWLTQRPAALQLTNIRRERRLSTTRTWTGAGIQSKRAISLDQESKAAGTEGSGLTRARSADSPLIPQTSTEVVLRRPSRDLTCSIPQRASTGSLSTPTTPGTPEQHRHSSPVPQSPHRVSWIEDGVWLPPPRPSSLLQPPSLELDSLSISSIEEEQESQLAGPAPHHPSAHGLAGKVINRLSAVGQALGGLVSQKKRLTNRVVEMSEKKGNAFGEAVKGFVEMTLKGGSDPTGPTGAEYLQEVRSSLSSLREMLLDYPDIQAILDSITDLNDPEIDSLVEVTLHKVALKPVSSHLYSCIHTSRTNDGSFQHLQGNFLLLEKNGIEELGGSKGVGVPDSVSLERIQQRWASMHEAYSPNKKNQILLKVCKSIYHSMSTNATSSAGAVFGADDFLPCLTWVLLRSNLVSLQVDTDYMMELLDPTQLQGEGGYYLTTLYASLFYITSFQPRLAARQLSVEAQHSINQWHRRRTLHCNKSRRSMHRRTIRRQTAKQNLETETASKSESGGQYESENADISEQHSETSEDAERRPSENTECEQELGDQPQTTELADFQPAQQKEVMTSEQEDKLSVCTETEEAEDDSDGELREDLR